MLKCCAHHGELGGEATRRVHASPKGGSMKEGVHDSHQMCACRNRCFTDFTQPVVQQNGAHVPKYLAIPAAARLRPSSQALLPLRSCGDVRKVLWPIPPW